MVLSATYLPEKFKWRYFNIKLVLLAVSFTLATYETFLVRFIKKFFPLLITSSSLHTLDLILVLVIISINLFVILSCRADHLDNEFINPIFVSLLLFCGYSFFSVVLTDFLYKSFWAYLKLLAGVSFLFSFYYAYKSVRDIRLFFWIIVSVLSVGIVFDFFYSIYVYFSHSGVKYAACRRVFGAHTSIVASFVLSVLLILKDTNFNKYLKFLLASIVFLCFIGARSKTGIISTFIFYPLLYEILVKRACKRLIYYIILFFLLSIAVFKIGIIGRMFKVFDGKLVTVKYRFDIWYFCFKVIKENFLLGTGIGSFKEVVKKFGSLPAVHFAQHAHNYYIHLLLEEGLLGFSLWLGFLSLALKNLLNSFKEFKNNFAYIVLLFGVGITLLYQIGDSSLHELYFQSFFYSIVGVNLSYVED